MYELINAYIGWELVKIYLQALPDVGVGIAVSGSNRDVSVGEWDDGNPKLRDTDEALCV